MSERAPLPDFELPMTSPHQGGDPRVNQGFQLSAFKGQPFVPCFHPRENTPGGEAFGVMKMKNIYGRQVLDCVRSAV